MVNGMQGVVVTMVALVFPDVDSYRQLEAVIEEERAYQMYRSLQLRFSSFLLSGPCFLAYLPCADTSSQPARRTHLPYLALPRGKQLSARIFLAPELD